MKGALVTGAGIRIGRALAMALAEDGYFVFVHYNASAEGARKTVAEFVRKWLLTQERWKDVDPGQVHVFFEDETIETLDPRVFPLNQRGSKRSAGA